MYIYTERERQRKRETETERKTYRQTEKREELGEWKRKGFKLLDWRTPALHV